MSTAIWTDWQLWEKLCFILACGIVLVIIGGCIKLVYNHYRIRKYTQIAAEKAQIREQLERTASFSRGRAKEIPFGVRALESGIEVDGVWISGSNTPAGSTPANSTPGSPTLNAVTEDSRTSPPEKIASDRASLPSQMTRIEIPQPVYGPDDHRQSLHTTGVIRPTYQPRRSSGLRFSDSTEIYPESRGDQAEALAALEGHSIGFGPAAEVHEAHRRSKSWATTSWNESYAPTSESSQAASNRALLHPRHDPSNRLAGYPSPKRITHQDDHYDDTEAEEMQETQDMRPASAVYGSYDGRSPLSFEDLPDERTYQHPSPYTDYYHLPIADEPSLCTTKTKEVTAEPAPKVKVIQPPESAAARPRRTSNADEIAFDNVPLEKTLVHYPGGEAISQPRRSQVIRKINSGFEILRPGTFGQAGKMSGTLAEESAGVNEDQGKQRHTKRLHRRRGDANLGKS